MGEYDRLGGEDVSEALIPVTVVVMTKNEEPNIAKCLDSVAAFEQVIVVDSYSTDRTTDIARAAGAEVVSFRWNGRYPKKKQWCLENLEFRHEWVLYLDADEEVSDDLRAEIDRLAGSGFDKAGYFVGYDYVFLGRRLRHGLRVYKLVLFNRNRARFAERDDLDVEHMWEVEGHYQPLVDGGVGTLRGRMIHRDADDLYHYFERHNRYSDWEAAVRDRSGEPETHIWSRVWMKRLSRRIPMRPLGAFLFSFVVAGGFLDGRAGFHFALSRSFYYWQIGLKAQERAAASSNR
jgi:glycosyltransferase involved in cell wall biosynthesis